MARRPDYGSNIPLAREKLLAIADRLDRLGLRREVTDEIREVVARHMVRSISERRAPTKHGTPTRKQVAAVRRLAVVIENGEELSIQEIAERVGLNSGRVSEILNGLRGDDGHILAKRGK